MLAIPGKYMDENGLEYTLLMTATDGESGKPTVIYRLGDEGCFYSLSADVWAKRFVPVEEAALEEYRKEPDISEVHRRFFELFRGNESVYTLHWKNAFASEGHNYACKNSRIVDGCMAGVDSCKNCPHLRAEAYGLRSAEKHLNGEHTAGIFPITAEGGCRFALIGPMSKGCAEALLSVCRKFNIPAYGELFREKYRLWFFFASPVMPSAAAKLGSAVITAAMETSAEVTLYLYDTLSPGARELDQGSFGRPVILPMGKSKKFGSVFTDDNLDPLPADSPAIIGFRTITRSYLKDRLNSLGNARLPLLGKCPPMAEFPSPLIITAEAGLKIDKTKLTPKTLARLRCMCAFMGPPVRENEFDASPPIINQCFYETEREICLPRGIWEDLKALLNISSTEYTFSDKRNKGRSLFLSCTRAIEEKALSAAQRLLEFDEGILLGNTGSGKTMAVACILSRLKTSALILTADEAAKKRWQNNILELFGIDCERYAGKIDVRLITDEKLKDKYGLVILADCSRLPMSPDIYRRIFSLSPKKIYGITADPVRRDELWPYIRMLCGDIICRM